MRLLTSSEIDRIVAGIRAGGEVTIPDGTNRGHTTYAVDATGAFTVSAYHDGGGSTETCSEEELRGVIYNSPDGFVEVLRTSLRAALRDALLGTSTDRSPLQCMRELLAYRDYGEVLHHPYLLEAVIGPPDPQMAWAARKELATMDGNSVFHTIMSAIGYATRSVAAGQFGLRFFAAVQEMLGERELPGLRRYRADFRAMAGDLDGALEDLQWELARQSVDSPDHEYLLRDISKLADAIPRAPRE